MGDSFDPSLQSQIHGFEREYPLMGREARKLDKIDSFSPPTRLPSDLSEGPGAVELGTHPSARKTGITERASKSSSAEETQSKVANKRQSPVRKNRPQDIEAGANDDSAIGKLKSTGKAIGKAWSNSGHGGKALICLGSCLIGLSLLCSSFTKLLTKAPMLHGKASGLQEARDHIKAESITDTAKKGNLENQFAIYKAYEATVVTTGASLGTLPAIDYLLSLPGKLGVYCLKESGVKQEHLQIVSNHFLTAEELMRKATVLVFDRWDSLKSE